MKRPDRASRQDGSTARSRIWPMPIALGVVTLAGLVAGLVGDGVWDALAWTGLGLPMLACVWYGFKRRKR